MIYLLEDDENIRELVTYTLNSTGLSASGFEKPSEFYAAVEKAVPELVILDIMLPEEDGLTVLKKLRSDRKTSDLPVMMLTAKSSEYDKVKGLDGGADDYVAKPFGIMELVSRVKALLRRSKKEDDKSYTAGKLYVCPEKHIIRADGKDVTLTLKEFELLCCLFENRGIVLDRNKLLNKIWGYDFDGESRTVDVHIRTLRQKLGECGECIETIRGIGYKIGGEND